MALSVGAGLAIAGGASLIGGLFSGSKSVKAQRLANEANLRMNAENNQLQRDLANQKYEKDLEQWHRQNEYNSPEAQAQRYREAGINPYLADISGGQATSSPEMSLAQTEAGRVEPIQNAGYVGDALANTASFVASNWGAFEQAKAQSINNETLATKNILEIENIKEKTAGAKTTRLFDELQTRWLDRLNQSKIDSDKAQRDLWQMETFKTEQEYLFKKQELAFLPDKQRLERANMIADTAVKVATGQLTMKQAITEAKKWRVMDSEIARNYSQVGLNNATADNQLSQAMATDWKTMSDQQKHGDYVSLLKEEVRKLGYEADKAHWNSYPTTDEFWNGHDWMLFSDKKTRDAAWEIYKARRGLKIGKETRELFW